MINYKHLHYFWAVAKEGGVTRASERLHLTPQTISGQLSLLEEQLGEELFARTGRSLELTDTGRMVLGYADEIFSLGGELEEAIHHLPHGRPQVFKVGIVDVVPKSIAHRVLEPVMLSPDPVRIICREANLDFLLAELVMHRLDLVLADRPIPSTVSARGFSHKLGECGTSFFATKELAKKLKGKFPQCLNGQPCLIPGEVTMVRSYLMQWFENQQIHPLIAGEFDDSALMKAFGRAGAGIFSAPTPLAAEVEMQYGVVCIGHTDDVREQFYAISVERKIAHPAVIAITETTREWLFRGGSSQSIKPKRARKSR